MSRKRISIFAGAIVLVLLIVAGAMAALSSSSRDEVMPPPTFGGTDAGPPPISEVEMESATEAAVAAPAPLALVAEPELIAEIVPTDRKIIRNASLSLIVADLDLAIERIQQIVAGSQGDTSPIPTSGTRIPGCPRP